LSDLLAELNSVQREAVEADDGPVLVVAGAGSGKTRVLTTRVAWLLAERGIRPGEILAITFTNRAAREMRERVGHLVGPENTPRWLGTFHAMGARLLRIDGPAIGIQPDFSIYDSDDSLRLVKRVLAQIGADAQQCPPHAVRDRISRWKNAGFSPAEARTEAADWREAKWVEAYEGYAKGLRAANALDFDDLLLRPVELLDPDSPALLKWAGRFRHVLVDEFQDTNRLQLVFVKALSSVHRNVFVVGDDDQSIYGWRGACVENMLEFEEHFAGTRLIRLEQNYRSTGRILAAANGVIAHNRRRKGKTLWTAGAEGDRLTLEQLLDEEDEAARLVDVVRAELGRGLTRGDVVVLYRTNAQSRALEDALRRATVPYQIVGSVQFYERREVRDLLAYLKLTVNPRDDVSAVRIMNVPRRRIGDATVKALQEAAAAGGLTLAEAAGRPGLLDAAVGASACARVRAFFDQVAGWREAAATTPAAELVEKVLADTRYREFLVEDDPATAEGRLENVGELLNAIYAFAESAEEAGLEAFLQETALVSDVDRMQDDGGAVRLMTIHTAKGLEFPVVVVAGCEEGLLPHAANQDDDEGLEEERRLFYVALTRARLRVHLLHARVRRRQGQRELCLPSRYLAEIPADLLERRGEVAQTRPPRLAQLLGLDRPRPAPRHAASGSVSHGVSEYSQEEVAFHVGQQVAHSEFGRGVVARVEGSGHDLMLTVDFEDGGRKHLLPRFAHLRPVD
jgi:DNA helicase-2/ATP-dependent DNA helicase PcrA